MSRAILASDLDRTLIHPVKTIPAGWEDEAKVVEIYQERGITTASPLALAGLAELAGQGAFVPVTTRSRAQLQRITDVWELVGDGWAICANGATILRGGVEDREWLAEIDRHCVDCASVPEARAAFERDIGSPERCAWMPLLRDCDERFLYATLVLEDAPADLEAVATQVMEPLGWRAVLHGRKLYVLPVPLCKGRAVTWLRERIGAEHVLGAGDSALDLELVIGADEGWVPRDAELVHQDRVPPSAFVTDQVHVRAGLQIVEAALAAVAARSGGAGGRPVPSR